MRAKRRGGKHAGVPTYSFRPADVAEFRAVTGADEARAVRALVASKGDLAVALNRHLDLHGGGAESSVDQTTDDGRRMDGGRSKPTGGDARRARRQADLHEAVGAAGRDQPPASRATSDLTEAFDVETGTPRKRPRHPSEDGTEAPGIALDPTRIPVRPTPDAEGWVTSMPQDVEAEAETREATIEWSERMLASPRFEDAAFPPCASSIDGRGRGVSGGDGESEAEAESPVVAKCHCNLPAKIKTVHKDGPNQGRNYYGCGKNSFASGGAGARCQHFRWADDAPSDEASRAMRWRRFDPPRFRLVARSGSHSFSPGDVRQGAVGDCWFLSALAVVAERQDLVTRVVGPSASTDKRVGGSGAFLVRLFLAGRWRAVVVDPSLPVSFRSAVKVLRGANAKRSGRNGDQFSPAYSRAADNQLWVPLVEKAYAKAHGSYHAISGGWISEGLLDLTGCPTETIELDAADGEGLSSEQAWIRMLSYAAAGFPMGCATQSDPTHREVGLVGNHAYSVMEVREVYGASVGRQTKLTAFVGGDEKTGEDAGESTAMSAGDGDVAAAAPAPEPLRLLRIRNPWGRKEWSGEWGAGSEVWTRKLGSLLGHTRADDGTFWMSWHDFLCRFSQVDVCKAHRGWFAISLRASVGSNPRGGGPGVPFSPSAEDAAFEIEVAPGENGGSGASSWAYVMGLQMNKRGRPGGSFWYADVGIAVYVASGGGKGPAWVPVGCRLGARERVGQLEMMFEAGARYMVRLFSFAGVAKGKGDGEAPVVLRLYSARPLRVRRASFPGPPLAAAVHHVLSPPGAAFAASHAVPHGSLGGDATGELVKRRVVPLCGGAIVVCQTRGGVYVIAVNYATASLRVWLRVRARRGGSVLFQHPPPPIAAAPAASGSDASATSPIPGAALHEIPPGRMRVLSVAVSTGPSDRCRHALEIAAEQAGRRCAACAHEGEGGHPEAIVSAAARGKESIVRAAATERRKEGPRGEGDAEDDEEDDDDVTFIGEYKPEQPRDKASTRADPPQSPEIEITGEARAADDAAEKDGEHRAHPSKMSSVFVEFPGLSPPPAGTSDAELAAILARAIAAAAAEEIAAEEDTSGGRAAVRIVGASNPSTNWRRSREEEELRKPARPPPRHLAHVFAHVPASQRWRRSVHRRCMNCTE